MRPAPIKNKPNADFNKAYDRAVSNCATKLKERLSATDYANYVTESVKLYGSVENRIAQKLGALLIGIGLAEKRVTAEFREENPIGKRDPEEALELTAIDVAKEWKKRGVKKSFEETKRETLQMISPILSQPVILSSTNRPFLAGPLPAPEDTQIKSSVSTVALRDMTPKQKAAAIKQHQSQRGREHGLSKAKCGKAKRTSETNI